MICVAMSVWILSNRLKGNVQFIFCVTPINHRVMLKFFCVFLTWWRKLFKMGNFCKGKDTLWTFSKLNVNFTVYHNIKFQLSCFFKLPWDISVRENFTFQKLKISWKKRSSRLQMFFKIGVLKNFANFTESHLCRSLFLNKVAGLKACNFVNERP